MEKESFFGQSRLFLGLVLFAIFALGLAVRLYDLTDPPLDFSRIAASFGVKGVRIEHPDQIGDAVREAQAADEPRLVDIVIDGDIRSRWL